MTWKGSYCPPHEKKMRVRDGIVEVMDSRSSHQRKRTLVTVVTPSLNQAQFLEQTIDSVLSQDYAAIEYLVMDGGSRDGSADIIRRHAHRLAFWQSTPDGGQAAAINAGWTRAQGDVLAYLNSDDYYLPGALAAVVRVFDEHPDVGLVHGQGHWVGRTGKLQQTTRMKPTAQSLVDSLGSLPQPAVFIRRSVFERLGLLDESLHFALDKEYYLRVIGNFPFISLDRPLACLRMHGGSKSVSSGMKFAPEVLRVGKRIADHPEDYPRFSIDPVRVMATAHASAAQFLYMGGQFRCAASELARCVRLAPTGKVRLLGRELPRFVLRAVAGRAGYLHGSNVLRRLEGRIRG